MTDPRHFDGQTFSMPRDGARLSKQWEAVRDYMQDGRWRTLREISEALGYPESSISARLRDLRKPRFGCHVVERDYVASGLHRYRLLPPEGDALKVEEQRPVVSPGSVAPDWDALQAGALFDTTRTFDELCPPKRPGSAIYGDEEAA